MKHNYNPLNLLATATFSALVLTAVPTYAQTDARETGAPASRPHTVQPLKLRQADGHDKQAYAIMQFTDGTDSYVDGMVSFPLTGTAKLSHVRYFGDDTHNVTAAAYANGYYYIERTRLDGTEMVPCELLKYDIDNDECSVVGNLTGFSRHIMDMTYDYSTGKFYALSIPDKINTVLYTIDPATAESAPVATMEGRYFTLACTYDGQLFSLLDDGTLFKIDKTNGAATQVGPTGLHPNAIQSMEFDHTDETLYWTATLQDTMPAHYVTVIDTLTAKASIIGELGNYGMGGLYVPFSAAAKEAPAAVVDFKVTPDAGGKNEAVLSWVNPTKTFGGKPLDALTGVKVLRDGQLLKTFAGVKPGQAMTYTDQTGDARLGQYYKYTVQAVNAVGDGADVKQEVFVGHDLPVAVTDLKVQAPDYDLAELTWSPSVGGVNGGYVDPASVTYTVTRMPGGKVLATGLKETAFTDLDIAPVQEYTYVVKAVTPDGESAGAQTDPKVLGPAYKMPFAEDFTAGNADKSWTFVDANNDGCGWMWTLDGKQQTVLAHQGSSVSQSDDWAISFYMPFEKGTRYRVDLDMHTYSKDTIDFYLLDEMDYAHPAQHIGPMAVKGDNGSRHYNLSFVAAADGYKNLALYSQAPMRADWMELHKLSVRKAEDVNLSALTLEGEANPVAGKENVYTVTVENQGNKPVDGYTVKLNDQDGQLLASQEVNTPLKSGDVAQVKVAWTPQSTATTAIVAEVQPLNATDEYPADNATDTLPVKVREAFDGQLVKIGTESTFYTSASPFDMAKQYAAGLNLYSAAEIGSENADIVKVAWPYDAYWQYSDVADVPVKVYMANTDLENTSNGWIPEADLTLVYEGKINIAQLSKGELTLTLDKPFAYVKGKNLAILTSVYSEKYYPYVYFQRYISPLPDNASYDWGNYHAKQWFDFTQTGSVDYYGYTASVMLYLSQNGTTAIATARRQAEGSYAVYSLNGQKVAEGQLNADGTVDAARLAKGVYVVNFTKDGKQQSLKLSVNK